MITEDQNMVLVDVGDTNINTTSLSTVDITIHTIFPEGIKRIEDCVTISKYIELKSKKVSNTEFSRILNDKRSNS